MRADDQPLLNTTSLQPGDLLDPAEVADILRIDVRSLANWRSARKGPPWVKLGSRAVRYRRGDIEAFIAGGMRGAA